MKPPKKRFSPRLIAFDEHRRKQISSFGGREIPASEHLMVLEDHLAVALRRRTSGYPLFKLQLALLMDLVDAEKAVAAYKNNFDAISSTETSTEDDKAFAEAELQKFQRIRRALRDIGDGIAWRLLDYDRAALTAIAKHARKPHINLDGLEAELHAVSTIYNQPEAPLAILNDLTHFLKKADITVRIDAGTFEFVEVKASRTKSGTLKRQRADLAETLRFLTEGQGVHGEELVTIQQLRVTPKSYLKALALLIREAERVGVSSGVIGDHLTVEFIDWPRSFELDVEDTSALERVRSIAAGWRTRGDDVVTFYGSDRYHEVRHFAPYSVYPLTVPQRVKLMTGALFTMSRVNVSAVLRYIEAKGWTVVRSPRSYLSEAQEDGTDVPVAAFKKGPLTIELPGTWLGRVATEYLAPRTIVDAFDAMLEAGAPRSEAVLANFIGEENQWD